MSKANDWAKRLETFVQENAPELSDRDGDRLAYIDDYGEMVIEQKHNWTNDKALALARWILDVFGEPG